MKKRIDGQPSAEINVLPIAQSSAHQRRGGLGDNSAPRAGDEAQAPEGGGDKLFG
ncbi:MAG TPA: hypothetical protein VM866_01095 [Pyrinomonadaceae bacterium]|nr:hypothetical protein [Pyrinomonadaceae bacterium]